MDRPVASAAGVSLHGFICSTGDPYHPGTLYTDECHPVAAFHPAWRRQPFQHLLVYKHNDIISQIGFEAKVSLNVADSGPG
jgi:hypothetical protein